jgi:hypothetical protein
MGTGHKLSAERLFPFQRHSAPTALSVGCKVRREGLAAKQMCPLFVTEDPLTHDQTFGSFYEISDSRWQDLYYFG